MTTSIRELPGTAWAAIVRWMLLIVLISTAISVGISEVIMQTLSNGLNGPGLAASIALPVLLGGPVILFHLIRLQQLRLANQKLQVLASTDWLTACLNRRAFTHQVSTHLAVVPAGAFLMIDADHFKIINDRFGHDRGDEVLQMMADSIKAGIREDDLVGRIGGEEFGVFLKGADLAMAKSTAERIRRSIEKMVFAPDGAAHMLSVSVGGAFYKGRISFAELFRIADQRLYSAKQMGRNRVEIADLRRPAERAAA